jgi:hypothetical protein
MHLRRPGRGSRFRFILPALALQREGGVAGTRGGAR